MGTGIRLLVAILEDIHLSYAAHTSVTPFSRVLRTDGVFLYITCGTPESRSEYFESEEAPWKVNSVVAIPKASQIDGVGAERIVANDSYYVIVLSKRLSHATAAAAEAPAGR